MLGSICYHKKGKQISKGERTSARVRHGGAFQTRAHTHSGHTPRAAGLAAPLEKHTKNGSAGPGAGAFTARLATPISSSKQTRLAHRHPQPPTGHVQETDAAAPRAPVITAPPATATCSSFKTQRCPHANFQGLIYCLKKIYIDNKNKTQHDRQVNQRGRSFPSRHTPGQDRSRSGSSASRPPPSPAAAAARSCPGSHKAARGHGPQTAASAGRAHRCGHAHRPGGCGCGGAAGAEEGPPGPARPRLLRSRPRRPDFPSGPADAGKGAPARARGGQEGTRGGGFLGPPPGAPGRPGPGAAPIPGS